MCNMGWCQNSGLIGCGNSSLVRYQVGCWVVLCGGFRTRCRAAVLSQGFTLGCGNSSIQGGLLGSAVSAFRTSCRAALLAVTESANQP
jgi:hypothetical protein